MYGRRKLMMLMLACCFVCCFISAVSAQTSNVDVSFYNIMSNTSTKQCNITGHDGPNTLQASVTPGKTSSIITVPVGFRNLGLTQVRANVSGSNQQLNVVINVTAAGESKSVKWQPDNSMSVKYVGKKFTNLMLKSTNNSHRTNSTKACLNVAVAYVAGNNTRNVTAVSIGCWALVNNSLTVQQNIQPKDLQSWVNKLNNDLCSGALSSLRPASLFTLLAASLPALLLATRS